jgi:hypothetical protein
MDALVAQGKPIPVYIVADPNAVIKQTSDTIEKTAREAAEAAGQTTDAVQEQTDAQSSWIGSILSSLSSLHAYMAGGGLLGGQGGGSGGFFGGIMDWVGGLFGGGSTGTGPSADAAGQVGGWAEFMGGAGGAAEGAGSLGMVAGMAEGGTIAEQIIGKGLQSGKTYTFGEKTPYGQDEIVAPVDAIAKKVGESGGGVTFVMKMPVNIQAIDTQTGTEFLMKNSPVLEAQMIKAIRNNRRLRDAIIGR